MNWCVKSSIFSSRQSHVMNDKPRVWPQKRTWSQFRLNFEWDSWGEIRVVFKYFEQKACCDFSFLTRKNIVYAGFEQIHKKEMMRHPFVSCFVYYWQVFHPFTQQNNQGELFTISHYHYQYWYSSFRCIFLYAEHLFQ